MDATDDEDWPRFAPSTVAASTDASPRGRPLTFIRCGDATDDYAFVLDEGRRVEHGADWRGALDALRQLEGDAGASADLVAYNVALGACGRRPVQF